MPTAFLPQLARFADQFADLSRTGSGAVVASGLLLSAIWQGALLAAAAALALRLIPRIPAAARFAIWFAVFTLIAALPFLGIVPRVATQTFMRASGHAWLSFDSRWTLAIAAVWAAASLVRAATLAAAALRVHTLSRRATPIDLPPNLIANTARRAQICSSGDVDRPTVIGFLSPKILIPAWLLEKLTPAELEQVVLHEASHLNRSDDWLNLLQKLALVLFPLNPALAWVERRLCFERELACDERVLSLLAARSDTSARAAIGYASCLATLAEHRLQRRRAVRNTNGSLALALGALGTSARESELGRRVARILRPVAAMRPAHVRLATVGAMLSLLFVATEFGHCPQIVSFAPVSLMPVSLTTHAPATQLARLSTSASQRADFLPGYRAVAARITLPAAPRMKPVGDAAPDIASAHSSGLNNASAVELQPHAVNVSANLGIDPAARSDAAPRRIAIRQPQPQEDLVITSWTVTSWQSSDGYRIVRTSAVISDIGADRAGDRSDEAANRVAIHVNRMSDAQRVPTPHAYQISQLISPYAAVPVPGGWLVFQL